MSQAIHTCKVVYSSKIVPRFSGIIKIRCQEDDDYETVKGKILKREGLLYLKMDVFKVRIIDSEFQVETA